MANQEPTPEEQRRYWDLQARRMGLGSLHEQAELVRKVHGGILPEEVLRLLEMVEKESTKAEDAFQYFMIEHPGKSFQVFNPDDIATMLSDEAEPLNFDELDDIDEPEAR